MQIKKGPYGYYAIEKLDDPDKLCKYAEEIITGNRSDFYLTPDTEQIGPGVMCCYEFSGFLQVTDREFSVFSSRKNASGRKEEKKLSLRRRSVGALLTTFIDLLDNLISPSCIVLEPDMIFTDPEGIMIKLCCLPVKSSPDDLCLSSLNSARLESLLNCDFFKSVINEDERNTLVYSVRENNEELFLKTANAIQKSDGNEVSQKKDFDNLLSRSDKSSGSKRNPLSKSETDLLLSLLSALFSIALLMVKMPFPCFLFGFLSLLILVFTYMNQKKTKALSLKKATEAMSRQRSSILFSDTPLPSEPESGDKQTEGASGNTVFGEVKTVTKAVMPMSSGQLILITDSKGVNSRYSILLDETNIGSDCFLSDIVIDDPQIAPLHAIIKQDKGAFYLCPAKGSGKTYIEDSPVENGKTYEIKSGQKITIGSIAFRFTTVESVRMQY